MTTTTELQTVETTALQRDTPRSLLAKLFDEDKVFLARNVVAGGDPTPDQIAEFLYHCHIRDLDPFAKQIYGILRKDKRSGGKKLTIVTSREGHRVIAERTGRLLDIEEPVFDIEPHEFDDNYRGHKHPNKCSVTVRFLGAHGRELSRTATVYWSEFAKDPKASNGTFWRDMPWHMLAKTAEVHALRKAFPSELGGIELPGNYDDEPRIKKVDANVRDVPRASREELDNIRPLPNPIDPSLAKDLERKAATPEIRRKEQERAEATS